MQIKTTFYSGLAQSVERMTVNHDVVGPSPTTGAMFFWGCSSVDRAPDLHSGGRGFESHQLHQFWASAEVGESGQTVNLLPYG